LTFRVIWVSLLHIVVKRVRNSTARFHLPLLLYIGIYIHYFPFMQIVTFKFPLNKFRLSEEFKRSLSFEEGEYLI